MVSFRTFTKLAVLIQITSEGEQKLEIIRQLLA